MLLRKELITLQCIFCASTVAPRKKNCIFLSLSLRMRISISKNPEFKENNYVERSCKTDISIHPSILRQHEEDCYWEFYPSFYPENHAGMPFGRYDQHVNTEGSLYVHHIAISEIYFSSTMISWSQTLLISCLSLWYNGLFIFSERITGRQRKLSDSFKAFAHLIYLCLSKMFLIQLLHRHHPHIDGK